MRILLLVLMLMSQFCFGQNTIPIKDGKITFSHIDSNLKANKVDLYLYAKEWIVNSFGSAKSVIEMEDKDQGRIMGKFRFNSLVIADSNHNLGRLNKCTFQIDCKDNKVRIQLYDFYSKFDMSGFSIPDDIEFSSDDESYRNEGYKGHTSSPIWKALVVATDETLQSFSAYIKRKVSQNDSDW